MKFNKPLIKIRAKDRNIYAQIAYLVDREDFISDVITIRIKLGINPVLHQIIERDEIRKRKDFLTSAGITSIFPHTFARQVSEEKIDKHFEVFMSLLDKYHRSTFFYNIVKFGIMSGEVWEKDYKAVGIVTGSLFHAFAAWPNFRGTTTLTLKDTEVAIIIYPETKKEEVVELFDSIQEYRSNNPSWKVPDTVRNIKRDRTLYWLNRQNIGYQRLATREKRGKHNISWEGSRDAIKAYDKKISVPLDMPL